MTDPLEEEEEEEKEEDDRCEGFQHNGKIRTWPRLSHAWSVAILYYIPKSSQLSTLFRISVVQYGPTNVLSHASHVAADVLFSDLHWVLQYRITFERLSFSLTSLGCCGNVLR